jgi:hypothetical protein
MYILRRHITLRHQEDLINRGISRNIHHYDGMTWKSTLDDYITCLYFRE